MADRIYKVSAPNFVALVRAVSAARALNHVVRAQYEVSVATVDDVADLIPKGVSVQVADWKNPSDPFPASVDGLDEDAITEGVTAKAIEVAVDTAAGVSQVGVTLVEPFSGGLAVTPTPYTAISMEDARAAASPLAVDGEDLPDSAIHYVNGVPMLKEDADAKLAEMDALPVSAPVPTPAATPLQVKPFPLVKTTKVSPKPLPKPAPKSVPKAAAV